MYLMYLFLIHGKGDACAPLPGLSIDCVPVLLSLLAEMPKARSGSRSVAAPQQTLEKPPVPVGCHIIPLRNGTWQERQALGRALSHWSERAAGKSGLLESLDHLALLSLLGGESSQDLCHGMLEDSTNLPLRPGEMDQKTAEGRKEDDEDRTIFFAVPGGKSYNRRRVIEKLRQEIPAELVQDILIDGRSWQEID
jgi:hypothetical protein